MSFNPYPEWGRGADEYDVAAGVKAFQTPLGEYLGAQVREGFWSTLPGQAIAQTKRLDAGEGETQTPLTAEDWRASPYFRPSIPFDEKFTPARAKAVAEIHDENAYRRWLIDQRDAGPLDGTLGFIAGIGGSIPDPVNFIPWVGPAFRAARVARYGVVGGRAIAGAVEGAIGAAVVQPFLVPSRNQFGDDVGFADVTMDIAFGAFAGAAIGGAAGLWTKYSATRAQTRARKASEAADADLTIAPRDTTADPIPDVQRQNAALYALDRAAQDVAAGRPIDIDPRVAGEMAGVRIEAARNVRGLAPKRAWNDAPTVFASDSDARAFLKTFDNGTLDDSEIAALTQYQDPGREASGFEFFTADGGKNRQIFDAIARKTRAPFDFVVYRGTATADALDGQDMFIPTTLNQDWAKTFASVKWSQQQVMEIVVPKGTPIIPVFRGDMNEVEILLPRGVRGQKVGARFNPPMKTATGQWNEEFLGTRWNLERPIDFAKAAPEPPPLPEPVRVAQPVPEPPPEPAFVRDPKNSSFDKVPPAPQRLADFLKGFGGIKDEGGEVSSLMGRKNGRPGLINSKRGLALDDATLYAWEAGYFPEFAERPTIHELLAALGDDLNGKPRTRPDADAGVRDQILKSNAQIDQIAHELDIDTRGITRAQFDDLVAERMSAEDAFAANQALADAQDADYARLRLEAETFLASRGDAWEPEWRPEGRARTLADMETEDAQFRLAQSDRGRGSNAGDARSAGQPAGAVSDNSRPGRSGVDVERGSIEKPRQAPDANPERQDLVADTAALLDEADALAASGRLSAEDAAALKAARAALADTAAFDDAAAAAAACFRG